MPELMDVYDRDRVRTGRTMERGAPPPPGAHCLVVHACVFNSRGEMLIQQRQPFKESWPDLWDFTMGGGATAGDSSRQAAQRELLEELGLEVDLRGARPHLTVNFENGFDDFYLLEMELDPGTLRLQPEEVKAARWATLEEIFALIDSGAFIPYYKSFVQLLFDMAAHGKYGSRSRADESWRGHP